MKLTPFRVFLYFSNFDLSVWLFFLEGDFWESPPQTPFKTFSNTWLIIKQFSWFVVDEGSSRSVGPHVPTRSRKGMRANRTSRSERAQLRSNLLNPNLLFKFWFIGLFNLSLRGALRRGNPVGLSLFQEIAALCLANVLFASRWQRRGGTER